MDIHHLINLPWAIGIFIASTVVIAIGGTALTREADKLADLTGMGEALFGAIFLGGITSLSGIVMSVTAAYEGYPQLSVSNAIGGIAAQTVFLAIADITYKKANLEHSAASLSNVMQTSLLVFVLAFLLILNIIPEFTFLNIHPGSVLIIIVYVIGQKMIASARSNPMWHAVDTKETKLDKPDQFHLDNYKLGNVVVKFILLGGIIALSGYTLAQSSIVISTETGLSENIVGALFTSVASSLPELIVSIAAVRQGALTLAVSNVIGGNAFDVLFVSFSDMFYKEGSIYHSFQNGQKFIILLTILLTTVLTLGLLYREKKGFAKIGWESMLVLILFFVGYLALFFL